MAQDLAQDLEPVAEQAAAPVEAQAAGQDAGALPVGYADDAPIIIQFEDLQPHQQAILQHFFDSTESPAESAVFDLEDSEDDW